MEIIKFYLALRRDDIAVYLADEKGVTDRLFIIGIIDIVLSSVTLVYCEGYFLGYKILDF